MLGVDDLAVAVAALLLLLVHHRVRVDAHDAHPALEQPLVQVVGLAGASGVVGLGVVRSRLERVLARPQDAGAVEAQDVAWRDILHVERQAQRVAFRQEVGEPVHVCDDVVRLLQAELREEVLEGARQHEGPREGLCGRRSDSGGGVGDRRVLRRRDGGLRLGGEQVGRDFRRGILELRHGSRGFLGRRLMEPRTKGEQKSGWLRLRGLPEGHVQRTLDDSARRHMVRSTLRRLSKSAALIFSHLL